MAVSLPIGFNFRQSEAYTTDSTPDIFYSKALTTSFNDGAYDAPTGHGWSANSATGMDAINRGASDARLAGVVYTPNSSTPADSEFRVDTGSGSFTIRLAIGDAGDTHGPHKVELFDGADSTAIASITGSSGAAGEFYDAQGNLHTSVANWVSSNSARSITLANSYLRVRIGGNGASGSTHIAHMRIDAAAVPNAPTGVTVGTATPVGFTVSWTDASSDETGFKVQTSPAPHTTWTTASGSPTAANATSLVITGLSDNTTYKARVASTNANGDSAWVESGTITTQTLTRLRPNADTTVGTATSTGANLFGVLDETVRDDGDYITIPGTLSSISLVQGHPSETNIKTWTPSLTGAFELSNLTMTSGEASAITDYSALYLKIVTSSTTVKLKFENSTDPGSDLYHSLQLAARQA